MRVCVYAKSACEYVIDSKLNAFYKSTHGANTYLLVIHKPGIVSNAPNDITNSHEVQNMASICSKGGSLEIHKHSPYTNKLRRRIVGLEAF